MESHEGGYIIIIVQNDIKFPINIYKQFAVYQIRSLV